MPKREPKKCRQWERERRNRLKTQFNGLNQVLPAYDPSAPLSKIDILKGATSYIKELQTLNKKVISGDQSLDDDLKHDLQMLDTRIQKLLNRNEQLVALLQKAGIRIPTELKADKQFCKPKLWSNKITKEKADILAEQVNNVAEKENNETKDVKRVVKKLKKVTTKPKNNTNKKLKTINNKKLIIKKTLKSKTLKVLHINNNLCGLVTAASQQSSSSQVLNVTNYTTTPPSKSIIRAYHPNSLQSNHASSSSIILNNPAIACKNAVVTNSTLLSTPIMATGITTGDSRSISSLGPGTLILANGNVFPILPGPSPTTATIIQQPTTLLVTNHHTAPVVTNQTLLVVGGKPSQTNIIESSISATTTTSKTDKKLNGNCPPSVSLKQYPRIAIKRPGITKTTTVNKVPIPALTSKYGRKIVGKENLKKQQSLNSRNPLGPPTPTQTDKTAIKRPLKNTTTKVLTTKKCETKENGAEDHQPLKKVPKLIEKDHNADETAKEVLHKPNDPEKKVPVSNYSVDSLCNKTETSQKSNEEKKVLPPLQDDPTTDHDQKVTSETGSSPSKSTRENNISSPVTSFLDVPTSTAVVVGVQTTLESTTISTKPLENLSLTLPPPQSHSDFSNDLFSTLHVPGNGGAHHHHQHPESISPTAAFLLAFPLVSTLTGGKTENADEETSESQHDPPTLLQIGNIDTTKQSHNTTESQISFDNIPNFYTTTVGSKASKKPSMSSMDPFKSKPSTTKLKGSATNILDAINTSALIPEIPSFQNHIFNYEHTPVTCPTTKPHSGTSSQISFQLPPTTTINNSSMEVNYSDAPPPYSISNSTTVMSNSGNLAGSMTVSTTSSIDLQITKTSTPYISKITTTSYNNGNREQFKYPDFKSVPVPPVTSSQKPLVNWMTTPSTIMADTFLPDFVSGAAVPTKTKYFKYIEEVGGESRNYTEQEQQYPSWTSSTTSGANIAPPSTLPMLMGDLALSTATPTYTFGAKYDSSKDFVPNIEDYYAKKAVKQSYGTTNKEQQQQGKTTGKQQQYSETHPNNTFLSVSQLVDHSKSEQRGSKTSPTKVTAPSLKQQQRHSKTEQVVKETSSFSEPTYSNAHQNWIKQSTTSSNNNKNPYKNPIKTEQKTVERYISAHVVTDTTPYDSQNWIKQSTDSNHKNPTKNEQKPNERYNCGGVAVSKETTAFIEHVPEIPFETQNWIKQSTNSSSSHKNLLKSELKTSVTTYTCSSANKESPFVSHVPNTTPYETQNWIKQSNTDCSNQKNPPKSEQKTVQSYNCSTTNKAAPFISHIPSTATYETQQNWMKQSTDSSNHKNPSKSEQKTVENYNYNTANKETPFVSHVPNSSYDTQHWIKQSTDSSASKNPPKSDQKTVENYSCSTSNKESPFISHVSNTSSYQTQNWLKQSTMAASNPKNPPKSEQKPAEHYNYGTATNKESHIPNTSFVSHIPNTPYSTQNWLKQSTTDSSSHKNTSKSERKPVDQRYNCTNNTVNKDSTFVSHVPEIPYETQNWMKQPTDASNHKNPAKSESKPVEGYNNCGTSNKNVAFVSHVPEISYESQNWINQSTDSSKNPPKGGNKESTFISHIPDTTSYDTQNWAKQSADPSNNKNTYKNQSKIEQKTVERYYNSQNETQNWLKNTPSDSNKNVYKNCSSTYSAEALISGQSSTNYPYSSTSKRGYVPTFDPIGIQPSFYNNEYVPAPQESTNYYPQNSNYHQNFQTNYQEFDTSDNYNTPTLFPPSGSGGASNPIKSCSKVKDNRSKIGANTSVPVPPPCSNSTVKRTNKRKQKLIEPPSTGTIGTAAATTTTLPGFSDLGFLSISSTNSPSLLPTDDPFHVPNLFNTTNNTNSSQVYSQNYSKNQHHPDHLMASTYTPTCNLLPPLASSVSLATRTNPLTTTQNIVSASPGGIVPSVSVGGNTLANFNLSTIFPEINKPVTSSGVYENSTYHHHHHRAPTINNNLPNLVPQQNCGNYTNLQ